jgi:hypothetical protein
MMMKHVEKWSALEGSWYDGCFEGRNDRRGDKTGETRRENSMEALTSNRKNKKSIVEWSGGVREFVEEGKNRAICPPGVNGYRTCNNRR